MLGVGITHCLTWRGGYPVDDDWLRSHPHLWEEDGEEEGDEEEDEDEDDDGEKENDEASKEEEERMRRLEYENSFESEPD